MDEKKEQTIQQFNQINIATDKAHIEACQSQGDIGKLLENLKEIKDQEITKEKNYIVCRSKEIQNYFVKTEPYYNALEKLKKDNIVLLVGVSGSGKSDNSIMLAAEYGKDCVFNYLEGSDSKIPRIEDLLKKNNYGRKEIIVFDDFLGKTQVNTDETYLDLVNELIKYISQSSNKKLILNSRMTILEDAKIKNNNFKAYIENEIDIIDISKLRNIDEKCKILANYVVEYGMEDRMKEILKDEKVSSKIFNHENFSPFIVKTVLCSCSKNQDKDLKESFFDMLDNPDTVWENEIKALNEYSKIYLKILYSMSDTWVKQENVDEAFQSYLEKKEIEYHENIPKTVHRLKTLLNFEYNRISFIHPSIIDYLKKEISVQEKKDIMEYATYFEQIERLDETKERIKLLYNDIDKFFSLKVLPYTYSNFPIEFTNHIGVKYLDYMMKLKLEVKEELVIAILQEVFKYGRLLLMHSASTILRVLLMNYDFSEFLRNEEYMQELYATLDYEDIWKLVEITCTKTGDVFDFKTIKPYIQQEILFKLDVAAEDKVNESIQKKLPDYVKDYFDNLDEGEEFYYEDVAREIVENIDADIDISSIVHETKTDLCEKHKISNYEDEIERYEIEIDYNFVERFIEEYNGD